MIPIRCFVPAMLLAALPLQGSVILDFVPGIPNVLSLETVADGSTVLAGESSGLIIGDQIDLRYSSDFLISSVDTPTGWSFQNVALSLTQNVATFFYTGVNPASTAENYNFSTPLNLQFNVEALNSSDQTLNIGLFAQLTRFHPDDGIAALVLNQTLDDAVVIPEPSTVALILLGAGAVMILRCRRRHS